MCVMGGVECGRILYFGMVLSWYYVFGPTSKMLQLLFLPPLLLIAFVLT